jgi:small nuclear ribonucleoprotein E
MQMEGVIIGFDEYMNMVLDDAVEMDSKKNTRKEIGRCLLKGDSITLLQYVFVHLFVVVVQCITSFLR